MTLHSPLRLDNYVIEKFHVEANLKYQDVDKADSILKISVEEARQRRSKDGAAAFSIRLSIKMNHAPASFKKAKYRVLLVLSGAFRIAPDVPENVAEGLVALNAPSILFGIARGHVAQATALGPWGRAMLPTVNFIALRQAAAPKKLKARKKAKRRSRKVRA